MKIIKSNKSQQKVNKSQHSSQQKVNLFWRILIVRDIKVTIVNIVQNNSLQSKLCTDISNSLVRKTKTKI